MCFLFLTFYFVLEYNWLTMLWYFQVRSRVTRSYVYTNVLSDSTNLTVLGTSSEMAMAPHSSTLAWKIPWAEEPGRLQSMGSLRVRHDWATSLSLFTFMHWRRKMATHSSVLAWRIPGTAGEPGGLPSMGSHRVRHDWSDLAVGTSYKWNQAVFVHT